MCTPSACTATVTWSSELDFWETVAYTPGFLCKWRPRTVDVYVARRKGSPIFDVLIAWGNQLPVFVLDCSLASTSGIRSDFSTWAKSDNEIDNGVANIRALSAANTEGMMCITLSKILRRIRDLEAENVKERTELQIGLCSRTWNYEKPLWILEIWCRKFLYLGCGFCFISGLLDATWKERYCSH